MKLGAVAALLLALACAGAGRRTPVETGPLRLSELVGEGDGTRQASQQLVVEGLDADASARGRRALSRYELALQVDATNPFAYLALSRHSLEQGDVARALEYLDQAELLLDAQGARTSRVEVHLVGLRGAALRASGRIGEAEPLLARARATAPEVWGDDRLSAGELR